jgi:UDP-N-acetyl-D-galactosamine dehydrogenase
MNSSRIAVIGLGYVGLPLALELSKKYTVLGYDINTNRIDELNKAEDHTRESDTGSLFEALQRGIVFSASPGELASCTVYIVTVPTPIDHNNQPDLSPLMDASKTIGQFLKKNRVVPIG